MTKIIDILTSIRPGVDYAAAKGLVDGGLIDSFDMIALVGELEAAYGVAIGLEELEPGNFNSVEQIAALLARLGAAVA